MSLSISFTEASITELKKSLQGTKDVKIFRRIQAILWKSQSIENKEIADLLFVSQDTITDWIRLYLDH